MKTNLRSVDGFGAGWTSRLTTAYVASNNPFDIRNAAYGALCDGTTDDTAAILACLTANGIAYIPKGTTRFSQIVAQSNYLIYGEGPDVSILKQIDSANTDAIYGAGSDALWGTNTNAGVENVAIENLTIDGNSANQTTGGGIAIYGQRLRFSNIYVKQVKRRAIRTEWFNFGDDEFGMEGFFENVRVDTCGREGWYFKGPHDSTIRHLTIVNSGQDTDNTYNGLHVEDYGASQFEAVHVWNDATTSARNKYGIYTAGYGSTFNDCHAEGAKSAQVWIAGQYTQWIGGRAYASFSGAPNLVITQPCQVHGIYLGGSASGEAVCKGIVLGTGGGSENVTLIDVIAYCAAGDAAVDCTYESGKNSITVFGIGSDPSVDGTPNSTSIYNVYGWDFESGLPSNTRQLPGATVLTGSLTQTVADGSATFRSIAGQSTIQSLAARYSADVTGPSDTLQKARGTIASPGNVLQNDEGGRRTYEMRASGAFREVAREVVVMREATPSSTALAVTHLTYLAPDGSATMTEFMSQAYSVGLGLYGSTVIDAARGIRYPSNTSVELNAIANAANTANKAAGKTVWNSTASKLVTAVGSTAGSIWVDGAGTTINTPV